MMTLEEAIKHCEEVTEENQKVVDTGIVFDDVTIGVLCCDDTEVINEHLANYQECADRHKQLAEWLKELKQLREQTSWIPMIRREPTDEEKAEYLARNGEELGYILENEMPENGKEVLVSVGCHVAEDVYYEEFYNFDGYDIADVDAWMPLPEPYNKRLG